MNAVSCTVTSWLLDLAQREGVSSAEWIRDLPVREDQLRGPEKRIDWDLFSALCHRLERLVGGREALRGAALRSARDACTRAAASLEGDFDAPGQLYWVGQRWLARALLPGVGTGFERLAPDRFRLRVSPPERGRPCPQLFALTEALLRAAPLLIGAPEAQVSLRFGDDGAVYDVGLGPARGGRQRIDLNAFVSRLDRRLRGRVGPGIELVTSLEGLAPPIESDPQPLEELLVSLVVNARAALAERGRLEIATGAVTISPAGDPRHPGLPPGEWATLSVSDTEPCRDGSAQRRVFTFRSYWPSAAPTPRATVPEGPGAVPKAALP